MQFSCICSALQCLRKKKSCKCYLKTTVDFYFIAACSVLMYFWSSLILGFIIRFMFCTFLTVRYVTSENSSTCSYQYYVLICSIDLWLWCSRLLRANGMVSLSDEDRSGFRGRLVHRRPEAVKLVVGNWSEVADAHVPWSTRNREPLNLL